MHPPHFWSWQMFSVEFQLRRRVCVYTRKNRISDAGVSDMPNDSVFIRRCLEMRIIFKRRIIWMRSLV